MVQTEGPEPPIFENIEFYITKSTDFSTLKSLGFPQEFNAELIGFKRHGTLLIALNYNDRTYFMPSSECSPINYSIHPQKLQTKLKRSTKRTLISRYLELLRNSKVRIIPKVSKIQDGRIPSHLQIPWEGSLIGYIHNGDTIYYQVTGPSEDTVSDISSMHFIIEAPKIEKSLFDAFTSEKAQKEEVKTKKVLSTLQELADFLHLRFNVNDSKEYEIELIDHIAVLRVKKGDIEATISRSLIIKKASNPFFRESLVQAINDFRKSQARRQKNIKRFSPARGRPTDRLRRRY